MPRDRAACHRPDLEATIRAFSHRKLGVHTRSVLLHARPCRYAEAARACCVLRASDLSDKGGASGGGKSGDGGGGASGDGGDGGGRERNGGDLSGLAICHYVPCRSAASLSGLAVTLRLCAVIFIQWWLLTVQRGPVRDSYPVSILLTDTRAYGERVPRRIPDVYLDESYT